MLKNIKNLPVLYSITNSASEPAEQQDKHKPFDFFTFLKYMPPDIAANVANESYKEYITVWAAVNNYNVEQEANLTQNLYIELLKDISLNYLTYEEKRAIANTDFNNKQEVEIILPFYSQKLREICEFYCNKRESLKQHSFKIKTRGTASSVSRSIYDSINEYVFLSNDENLNYNTPPINLETIANNLSIEIEELYDVYSNYFDVDVNQTVDNTSSGLRATFFSHNVNNIEYNIFVDYDTAIKQYIIDNFTVYLTSLAQNFAVYFDYDLINLNCKVGDPLYNFTESGKSEANSILKLKKQLIEKYIGTDIYYVSAGDDINSVKEGVLLKAKNPTGNLLNRHFPTAAAINDYKNLITLRKLGLFFKPEKFGLLQFSVPENRYKIDKSKLSPNTVYVFPDPNRYGDTTGLTNTTLSSPIMHVHKYTTTIQNEASFSSEGDPRVVPTSQSFYAYTSKQQSVNKFELGEKSLLSNFSSIVNKGVVKHWCEDIFGDQYVLIEKNLRKHIENNIIPKDQQLSTYTQYDGGIITFSNNALLPERSIADNPNWVFPNIYSSEYYYNALLDGSVGSIQNGMMVRGLLGTRLFDGWNFTLTDFANTGDAVIFNPSSTFYSISTIDGGYFTDIIAVTADFSFAYAVTSMQYELLDGGDINHSNEYVLGIEDKNYFIDSIYPTQLTQTVTNTQSNGSSVYIRDVATSSIYELSAHRILKRYNSNVVSEILNLEYFNVYKDTIYFKTRNYFIADKILYDKNYLNLSAKRNVLQLNIGNKHNVLSHPFFFEDGSDAVLVSLEVDNLNSNSIVLKPILYKIDGKNADIYDVHITNLNEENFTSPLDVKIVSIDTPTVTFNSRVGLYSMIATLRDKNNLCYLYQIYFDINARYATVEGVRVICLQTNSKIKTINFFDTPTTSMLNINTSLNNITTKYTSISVNTATNALEIYESTV